MKINDAHIHIVEHDSRYGIDLIYNWSDLGKAFEEGIISFAQVIPTISFSDNSLVENEIFFDVLDKQSYKDRVWGFYWPHPDQVDFEFAARDDVAGIKYHPSISQKRIDKAPYIIKVAQENGVPLLVHCGRNPISHIEYVLNASQTNPDVIFIAAHLGGLANELILSALDLINSTGHSENLFLDTSGCVNPKILKRVIETVGDDYILFGTDLPFFDIEVSKYALQLTELPAPILEKVLYSNLIRLHSNR